MNKFKTLLEKIRNNNINWKSKKTIAAVTVAAAVLFAALTGVTALTVRHINTEPAQTTLPVAEEVTAAAEDDEVSTTTAADAANIAPASTTTPAQVSGMTNSKTSASSNNSTGSKNTGKTGSSTSSGSASHSSGTDSKPATGSNSSNSNSKPSGGSSTKPTTTKPATTQPAKKEFAMTKQEIIDYASNYIESTYHCTYYNGFGKDVPGTGYNAPFRVFAGESRETIIRRIVGSADATYGPNGWYKVYVEMEDEDTMRVYLFY